MKILLYLALFVFLILFKQGLSQSKWDYPVKPGSDEWKSFQTTQEMIDKCQIPEGILGTLPTKDLLEICLNYPFYGDVGLASSLQDGFDHHLKKFNGLYELMKREDVAVELMQRYLKINLLYFDKNWPSWQNGKNILRLIYFEIILGQYDILEKLSKKEKRVLMNDLINKYNHKLKDKKAFGGMSKQVTLATISRIMEIEKFGSFNKEIENDYGLKLLCERMILPSLYLENEILQKAQLYLKDTNKR